MPLRYTGDRDIPGLNRWADDIENRLEDVDEIARKANLVSQDAVVLAAASGDIPPDPGSCTVVSDYNVVDGVVYNLLTCSYRAPNPLDTFAGVFLVVAGYKGSTTLVKVAESNYVGPAGGTQTFKANLERTSEVVTCYFVAKTSSEVARPDWVNAPSVTVTLNVYPSIPVPVGFTAFAEALGVRLSWGEVTGFYISGYNVYRNTVNNSSTATQIATVTANTSSGVATFFDKSASVNTLYFYWVKSVTLSNLEGAFSSAVSNAGIGPGTHSSYRPLTNPLTATDAGASATVSIAAFTMRIGGLDVSYNSGSITSLSYNTVYYIYFTDVTFAGGAVTYLASTSKETILNNYGQLFVGSVLTPLAGADSRIGNNDGGAGAQIGNLFRLGPGGTNFVTTGNCTSTNPEQALDGDTSTYGQFTVINSGALDRFSLFVGKFSAISFPWKSLTLKAKTSVPTNTTTAGVQGLTVFLKYINDFDAPFGPVGLPLGGTSIYILGAGATRAVTTDSLTLPLTQNLAQVLVAFFADAGLGGVGEQVDARIYDAWIEGVY